MQLSAGASALWHHAVPAVWQTLLQQRYILNCWWHIVGRLWLSGMSLPEEQLPFWFSNPWSVGCCRVNECCRAAKPSIMCHRGGGGTRHVILGARTRVLGECFSFHLWNGGGYREVRYAGDAHLAALVLPSACIPHFHVQMRRQRTPFSSPPLQITPWKSPIRVTLLLGKERTGPAVVNPQAHFWG